MNLLESKDFQGSPMPLVISSSSCEQAKHESEPGQAETRASHPLARLPKIPESPPSLTQGTQLLCHQFLGSLTSFHPLSSDASSRI